MMEKNALEIIGIKNFDLIIPYVPYARQDRICNKGEAFGLKVFANLINAMNFDRVHVLDAHSDVAPALINNCSNHNNHKYVYDMMYDIYHELDKGLNHFNYSRFHLISPDAGAVKKMNALAIKGTISRDGCHVIKCDKERDVSTGELKSFNVYADNLEGKDCIIVDDICSRGGTFMGLSKELKNRNAGNIYLFVTHYEGVADEYEMKKAGIKMIYKTNSMNDIETDFIKNFKITI